jgi:hypothetical protein
MIGPSLSVVHTVLLRRRKLARALLSAETHGTIDQSGHKPLEAHRNLVQLTSEFLYNTVYHTAAY